jgi:hypothetical protein
MRDALKELGQALLATVLTLLACAAILAYPMHEFLKGYQP